jgi:acyl-[acyl-carrier-protein]-phospholipid O-acyltransferase/long-chain-fatty-acid--[acyl-carrier-protein] ligase
MGNPLAVILPISIIEKLFKALPNKEDDIVTIIFSSGSEGNPKGVMLSKRNIMSQSESVKRIVWHDRNLCILGFLPFFHSFGYTVTIWLTLTNGVRSVYHPNPLEPKIIGGLAKKYEAHFLLGTSSFLQGFIAKCSPEDFKSLQYIIAERKNYLTVSEKVFLKSSELNH